LSSAVISQPKNTFKTLNLSRIIFFKSKISFIRKILLRKYISQIKKRKILSRRCIFQINKYKILIKTTFLYLRLTQNCILQIKISNFCHKLHLSIQKFLSKIAFLYLKNDKIYSLSTKNSVSLFKKITVSAPKITFIYLKNDKILTKNSPLLQIPNINP
jgi:hypothetical protein